MATLMRTGIHDPVVVTDYVGVALAACGAALIVSGLVSFYRAGP